MIAPAEVSSSDAREVRSHINMWPLAIVPDRPSPFRRVLSAFRLPLPLSERRLLLAGLDLLALGGVLLLSLALRREHILDWRLVSQRCLWFLLLGTLWLSLAHAFGAYDLHTVGQLPTAARAVLKAGLLTALIYLVIPVLRPALPASRPPLAAFPLLVIALLLAERAFCVLALAQPVFCRRTLIIGAGPAGRTIAQAVVEHGDGMCQVVGFVDDDPAKQGTAVQVGERDREQGETQDLGSRMPLHSRSSTPLYVLGNPCALRDLIAQHHVTTLVLAITRNVNGPLLETVMNCLELGVEVIPMPVLYEELTGHVPVEYVGDSWYVAIPIQHAGTGALWPLLKRLVDIILAGLGLIFLGLSFPFIAIGIYLDSPGPIFYTQRRLGKGGRIFRMHKFRSMIADAEKGQAVWAEEQDPRVTRVGRILRKTHVDEFPQFLNILKGEMSVVGPRPERPEFVEELAREIPFYRVRHAVKPGMAGWGLVKQGYGSSKEDALLKLQYDLYYVKHQSLWLDLAILMKTVLDVLSFNGR